MPEAEQRETDLKLKLGSDQIEAVWVDAYERLSQPFTITLDIVASLGPIKLVDYLGKTASIEHLEDGQHQRFFNGVVVDGRFLEHRSNAGYFYRLTLRPKAYLHTQGRNFRIYQHKSVIDTVTTVLGACGIVHEVKASGGKRTREYCVQYGESDFDFVSRLLEEDGLYYHYEHTATEHKLVIDDATQGHPDLSRPRLEYNESIEVMSDGDRHGGKKAFVTSWIEQVSTGSENQVTFRDFNYARPATPIEGIAETASMHDGDKIEFYDWPGRYRSGDEGYDLAKFLLESRRAQRVTFSGLTQFGGMECGRLFTLTDHDHADYNRGYLIIGCHISIAAEQVQVGQASHGGTHAQFVAIPDDVEFRAPIVTPRPVAKGPETAFVTGPPGEEIHVDKLGCIRVHFHWDRDNPMDDTSSCWVRVSQTGGLGNMVPPRIGQEVIVDFINGDPDKPIVTGRVYNDHYLPAHPLPANMTRAVWRSKTHKQDSGSPLAGIKKLDTGAPGANEFVFEDKTGAEKLMVHAERDMSTRIRKGESHHVGEHQDINIGGNRVKTVDQNEKVEIGKSREATIGENEKVSIAGKQETFIKGDHLLDIKGKHDHNIGKNLTIDCKAEVKITAAQKITLEVGGSSIVMDGTSITIKSIKLAMEASATAMLKGAMTNVEAQGFLTAKGAMVFIN